MNLKYFVFLTTLMIILTNCQPKIEPMPVLNGVAASLAEFRAQSINNLTYNLFFDIPEAKSDAIPASVTLSFELTNITQALQIDFKEEADHILAVKMGEEDLDYTFENEHIVIAKEKLIKGMNTITIDFIAGELSLNRNDDYLYTLLVPDRARTVFPCFDQPNIKAVFELSLEIPQQWKASSNGSQQEENSNGNRKRLFFQATERISTYLFAFVVGDFQLKTANHNGREMNMLYRESDSTKVNANAQEIFSLHAHALGWLEEYTGIQYPFEKFDFVLIPTFQYGGMEHVGNIFYRESALILEEGATPNQLLGRASLIAHETAHMWFGDLVTMDWFNDVWLKEVFANFMAAKIVNPSFPEINHELRFLLAHQPSAYGEDRSEGSHPIQQKLDNLQDAGTLYGRIIYQKAPVVMRQLEDMMGEESLRNGLREYLRVYSFDNATWDDLIYILDDRIEMDLFEWSQVWVQEAQMPIFNTSYKVANGVIEEYNVTQQRPAENGSYWQEETMISLFYADSIHQVKTTLSGENTAVDELIGLPEPLAVLSGSAPISYGYFILNKNSQDYFINNSHTIDDPVLRGAIWVALYESFLNKSFDNSNEYLEGLKLALTHEQEPLNRQRLLSQLSTVFWKFQAPNERAQIAPEIENLLWRLMNQAENAGAVRAYYNSIVSLTYTEEAREKLLALYKNEIKIPNLRISESNRNGMATALALRLPDEEAIPLLEAELAATKNPDRKKRLEFLIPSLVKDPDKRVAFFESLKEAENRAVEPWAGAALSNLNHPLLAEQSLQFIRPSLELMEEIQLTGDIFFPRRWVGSALNGHNSPEAAKIVRDFLEERPDYPAKLKNKILMASDLLFRASEIE